MKTAPPPALRNNSGFTLVELMVVVAIIGILAAVGIPSFKKYQAQSKTTEAKVNLAAIYSAETTFHAEFDTYASCLPDMGFDPSSATPTMYYTTGFFINSPTENANARANGATCSDSSSNIFLAGKGFGGTKIDGLALGGSGCSGLVTCRVNNSYDYKAGAMGYISTGGAKDSWYIRETKKLVHASTGY